MEKHIDYSYDNLFQNVDNLTWLPWIGKLYNKANRKLLIVGESHYVFADNDLEYNIKFKDCSKDKNLTRECIYESPICSDWRSVTFENIHRVLLETNNFDKEKLWEQIAYYNFIPRLMDYRKKERPEWIDFYSSWRTFIEVIRIIEPTDCIFIGVTASYSFNLAMEELGISYTSLQWLDSIGTTYSRISKVKIENSELSISFIQHASQMFSWSKWNNFLKTQNKEIIEYLTDTILGVEINKNEEPKIETPHDIETLHIPTHLTHKPVIACNYSAYTGNNSDDAKYLSIGRAQYDYDSASIKLFRHTGEKWSRQSEELPISRVADMTLMLLATIKKLKLPNSSPSILNEIVLNNDDLTFLRSEIESNNNRIKTSLLEIRKILNEIDIENDF